MGAMPAQVAGASSLGLTTGEVLQGWVLRLGKPPGQLHPQRDEAGRPVVIHSPSAPSTQRAWKQPTQIAAVVPGGKLPASLHRVPFLSWTDAPLSAPGWEALAGAARVDEPAFKAPTGLLPATGVVIRERDGRVWVVCPTNQFGGHAVTFPKGSPTARACRPPPCARPTRNRVYRCD